ncbi:MAG: hypothetical protein WCY27_01960 [archaeon]|nr:hypothetical protein [archaeon]MDD2477816.1 hypothetical protein [Candidatus ainarchaeum sp.]MDD3084672.1 hypothetical protein [Candidatus ainarchaeum sp.]MDD4221218.1 hypothetical protein [Candidatus ainarchaeum sp.]MDD4662725.1 hypothetical protein [Candidatus ainarchaeum sp.]
MNKNRGLFFTIDGLFALIFITILLFSFNMSTTTNTDKDLEKIIITSRISDLLITSQLLEIDNLKDLEKNYNKLFENKGYVKIDSKLKEINSKSKNENQLISQSIKYINSSNKVIYIEIGVYY